jgi:large subunit ribosomal protein L25
MQKHILDVTTRAISNKGALKRTRAEGKIPANIYGKGNAKSISVSAVAFKALNKEIGGGASLIELHDEAGVTALTHVQSIDVNPITRVINHIDFHEVARGESFVARIPVLLTGMADCEGVKHEGGLIDHKTLELEIRCLPSKLPENISIDVSALKVGDAIHVDDIAALDGVEFLANGIQVVVSCQPPTVAVESTSEAPEEEVAADEVPVIEKKSEDGEDSEDSEES